MSVRILTKDLLLLLADHLLTAAEETGLSGCAGILLHTAKVEVDGDAGAFNCLVATSTNGRAIGHSWMEAGGSLLPTLLPVNYVRALIESLKKLLNKDNRNEHVSNLSRDGEDVVIAEDPDLFEHGFTQRFAWGDLDTFPRSVFPLLTEMHVSAPPDMKPAENRTDYTASVLAPFLTIANRHATTISIYRVHQAVNVHIQIGISYRGLIAPSKGWNDSDLADGQAPDIGVYEAELPPLSEPDDVEQSPSGTEPAGANA